MKTSKKIPRILIATILAGSALAATGSAVAYERVIVSDGPAPYAQPEMVPVGVSINIGWHGDRYWDGHRYWAHDDWMRGHPHDRDPHNHGDHDHHHD